MAPDTPLRDLGVSALRLRRDELQKELAHFESALDSARVDVSGLSERFRALTRERAVAKREIQAIQNDLYLLKRKRAAIEEKFQRYAPAYQEGQAALSKLLTRQRTLLERIDELDAESAHLSGCVYAMEAELHGGDHRLNELEHNKLAMVEDISMRLKSASLDRDKLEDALNDVAIKFRDVVSSRDQTLLTHAEIKERAEALRGEVQQLEFRIANYERLKTLRVERVEAQREAAEADARLATAQGLLENVGNDVQAKMAALDQLTVEAAAMTHLAEGLERELGVYARALSAEAAVASEMEASRSKVAAFEAWLEQLFTAQPFLVADLALLVKTVGAVSSLGLARK